MAASQVLLPLAFIAYLLLLLIIYVFGQQQQISISSIVNTSIDSKWISPNGEFAFGFYNIKPTQYLIGVWFDEIDIPKTLVWIANRDKPLEEGSTLQLNVTGLNVFDSQGKLQTIFPSLTGVNAAEMRENGNFVLLDISNNTIWQSFDHPTDTLLPGQTLKRGSKIYSRATNATYSTGRFVLAYQKNGDLILSLAERLGDNSSDYWRLAIGNNSTVGASNLNISTNGYLCFADSSSDASITPCSVSARKAKEHAVRKVSLDADGILRGYLWSKGDGDGDEGNNPTPSWVPAWKALDNPCQVSGQCGFNSICNVTQDMLASCTCPPGFSLVDKQYPLKGCLQNSYDQICSANASTAVMMELESVDWPGNDYATILSFNESECKQACLDDCMCMVAIYEIGICWKKANPLRDGRITSSSKAFVKVLSKVLPPSTAPSEYEDPRKESSDTLIISIAFSLVGCFSALIVVILIIWFFVCLPKLRTLQEKGSFSEGLKAFTYQELSSATKGFKEELGRGAFGMVYKGKLLDGRMIAVKKLEKPMNQDSRGDGGAGEKEFRAEMNSIGATHHKNLVQLYGFCEESSHRLLVYEYMSNGSLDQVLFKSGIYLDWNFRVQIALGIARGLLYLHEECMNQILHCDIKPQNILLDENLNAKISDFGMAKLIRAEQTRTFTQTRGTIGYIAPEWHKNVAITVKVDIYSFGVMLLEIICCRKTLDLDAQDNEMVLSDWAYDCLKRGRLRKLVMEQLSKEELSELERMVLVGLWCSQQDPCFRPSTKAVVQMLEGTIEIAVPPLPTPPPSPSTAASHGSTSTDHISFIR
ncbi:hypothetical protein SUGI_0288230 [Cryptomeria japonica]|uniref:G-type lectin S-receptor-like serine/threonine-protein kinase LECRK4 n=1 Tax=Cryptomeria japonica TaxID=3369 RepID=UPI002408D42A|nr:G-type lectin S-receptor-like serine/threonine-protein kinase LECRK4 [Cryptomeria japonica]GLJ16749.1 hypothetical protein SUGI_0288230 [Cryptomeria japonica]